MGRGSGVGRWVGSRGVGAGWVAGVGRRGGSLGWVGGVGRGDGSWRRVGGVGRWGAARGGAVLLLLFITLWPPRHAIGLLFTTLQRPGPAKV